MGLHKKKREFPTNSLIFCGITNSLIFCGITWNRTRDTRIFSPLLYRLSYDTIIGCFAGANIGTIF